MTTDPFLKFKLSAFVLVMVTALAATPRPACAAMGSTGPGAVRDEVYLQETGRKIPSDAPLTSVSVFGRSVFAGSTAGLKELKGDALVDVAEVRDPVHRLVVARGALWALTSQGLHRFQGNSWQRLASGPCADLCEHGGNVIVALSNRLWRVEGISLVPLATAESPFPILRLASHNETLFLLGPGRLTYFEGDRIGGRDVYDSYVDDVWDWGTLPGLNSRDLLSVGPRLFIATERGLGVLRGMSLTSLRGDQGLCYEDTTCLARGFTNDVWIGTTRGAIRMVEGEFHYFAGPRWLPDDQVSAVASGDRAVYIATPKGLGIIQYEPFTLLKKADYYERHLATWGQKRLGFVHKLEWDDSLREFVREAGDNDGGYSGDYLAAQSYRYAVTKDAAAREEAVNTFQALRWLETMTGIPGFPARSVWAKGERGHKAAHGSGGYPAEWHDTADGRFEWKGDTSSDELCSHFYAISLFLELAARGEEIVQAKNHLSRIAGHLVDHGWQLIDLDGKPTRWGRWDPEYFKSDEGRFDRGLQCLEILSFLKTAETIGDPVRFGQAYKKLVELDYPAQTVRQRNTFPPDSIVHFEDQLALWSYWNLLKFEKDPRLRSVYRRSLERSWEIARIERVPWFNFVYGALTGNDCEAGAAVAHLREWPLDLIIWSYQNSHRADLRTPPGYVAYKAGTRTFAPRETEPMRWDHWAMQPDGGAGGRDVVEPSGWLVAYWMGRYHGFIAAPITTETSLLKMERMPVGAAGAKPYEGPPRPKSP